ncbi:MAG TPA: hypothetical protein VFT32_12050 [Candidatus Eisenbacteria bacterium]|nr:hypothetical protein [Candidatus Eisenbacteria bacterium]
MTRNPNDDLSFERRPVSRIARAAFALLCLAAAWFAAAIDPAPSPAEPAPSERSEARPTLQTPEEPEPGSGEGEEEFGDEGEEGEEEPPVPFEPEPIAPDSLAKLRAATPDSLAKLRAATPDSLTKLPAATLPSGAAPLETLGVTKPPVGAVRPGVGAAPAPPKERGTILGLHPAVFFAALIVGHVFIVRLVTD